MKNEVIIRSEAEEDLKEIFQWYEEQSKGLGSDFLRCIDASLNSIQNYPEMSRKVYKNIHRVLIRRFPYGIFYIWNFNKIIVLAVFHAKRNPKLWKKRITKFFSKKV